MSDQDPPRPAPRPPVIFPVLEDEAWEGEGLTGVPGPAIDDVDGATEFDTTPEDREPPERELPGDEP